METKTNKAKLEIFKFLRKSGPDCRDDKSAQMTDSRNSEEEDSKSNQSHATQVSKEQPHMGVACKGLAGVTETDQMIAMNTGGMSHSKT